MKTSTFHLVLTVLWLILGVPTFTMWQTSVPWLVAMSWYANVVGQWGVYQAAKAMEVNK